MNNAKLPDEGKEKKDTFVASGEEGVSLWTFLSYWKHSFIIIMTITTTTIMIIIIIIITITLCQILSRCVPGVEQTRRAGAQVRTIPYAAAQ